jgi:hypothetical protein
MVTTHSQWGMEPLGSTLPDLPTHPVKHRRQEPAAPDGAIDDRPTEAPEATLGRKIDTPK